MKSSQILSKICYRKKSTYLVQIFDSYFAFEVETDCQIRDSRATKIGKIPSSPNYGGYKVGGSAPSDPIRSMAKYIQTIRRLLPIFWGWRLKG